MASYQWAFAIAAGLVLTGSQQAGMALAASMVIVVQSIIFFPLVNSQDYNLSIEMMPVFLLPVILVGVVSYMHKDDDSTD